MYKKLLALTALSLFTSVYAKADEGMWIPMLINKNIDSMEAKGIQLSAKDIYDINHASLKDAVVHFGGGCTGEIISPNGLLITNHHCGFGSIAAVSDLAHNYLMDGFWAKNYAQEIPAPDLKVKFLVRMEDITDKIKDIYKDGSGEKQNKQYTKLKDKLTKEASENGKYIAQIQPYFNGNQYYLLVYQEFSDVRLVATPPKSLGKYGGDTDNWMWPRHTADFSVFRVYADKDNNPAAYSPNNVPYKPKQFLNVNISGVKPNDFAMIMGYPGRTNRYEPSFGVALDINEINPDIVKIRDMRLGIMRKNMKADKGVNLKLATSYASISNYWKYYIGQTEQLKKLKVIDQKQSQERYFNSWAKAKNSTYNDLLINYHKLYTAYEPYAKYFTYYREDFQGSAPVKLAIKADSLYSLFNNKASQEDINKAVNDLKSTYQKALPSFDLNTEKEMLARTAELFYRDVSPEQQPRIYKDFIFKQYGNSTADWSKTFNEFAEYSFATSFLVDSQRFQTFMMSSDKKALLERDPIVMYAHSFLENDSKLREKFVSFNNKKNTFSALYIKGLMEMNKDKNFYPDANSTMRVTYGTVGGYKPKDGIYYDYYTTIDGVMEKYIPGDYEFDLPQKFIDLYHSKNWGAYANDSGQLVTCFITNDDITGGNSGSPVMDKKGNLLGLAFDGNWEAMSGDIAFDKQFKRTIVVDIRYVLWLMKYYGEAPNLINEMTIIKNDQPFKDQ